jgi:hypothetical protein
VVKNLDDLIKPSLGTELIQSLHSEHKLNDVVSTLPEPKVEEKSPEVVPTQKEESTDNAFAGFIKDGIEVVDVKAELEKAEKKRAVDRFGIPIRPGEHRNFDRI